MTQMAILLPLWPKRTSNSTTSSRANIPDQSASMSCCALSKLLRKLKKRSKMLCSASRQSSFQCRYDPMSYSLNFDATGSGNFLDEEYYKFCAFSSRARSASEKEEREKKRKNVVHVPCDHIFKSIRSTDESATYNIGYHSISRDEYEATESENEAS